MVLVSGSPDWKAGLGGLADVEAGDTADWELAMVSLVSGHGATCASVEQARSEGYAWGKRFRSDGLTAQQVEENIAMFKDDRAGEFSRAWAESVRAGYSA